MALTLNDKAVEDVKVENNDVIVKIEVKSESSDTKTDKYVEIKSEPLFEGGVDLLQHVTTEATVSSIKTEPFPEPATANPGSIPRIKATSSVPTTNSTSSLDVPSPPLCFLCQTYGHLTSQCPDLRCKLCQSYGHAANTCTKTPGKEPSQEDNLRPHLPSAPEVSSSGSGPASVDSDVIYFGRIRWFTDSKTSGVVECMENEKKKVCFVSNYDVEDECETGDIVKFHLKTDTRYGLAAVRVKVVKKGLDDNDVGNKAVQVPGHNSRKRRSEEGILEGPSKISKGIKLIAIEQLRKPKDLPEVKMIPPLIDLASPPPTLHESCASVNSISEPMEEERLSCSCSQSPLRFCKSCQSYTLESVEQIDALEPGARVVVVAKIVNENTRTAAKFSYIRQLPWAFKMNFKKSSSKFQLLENFGSGILDSCIRPVMCGEYTFVTVQNKSRSSKSIKIRSGDVLGVGQNIEHANIVNMIPTEDYKDVLNDPFDYATNIYASADVYIGSNKTARIKTFIGNPPPKDKNMFVTFKAKTHRGAITLESGKKTLQFDENLQKSWVMVKLKNNSGSTVVYNKYEHVGNIVSSMTPSHCMKIVEKFNMTGKHSMKITDPTIIKPMEVHTRTVRLVSPDRSLTDEEDFVTLVESSKPDVVIQKTIVNTNSTNFVKQGVDARKDEIANLCEQIKSICASTISEIGGKSVESKNPKRNDVEDQVGKRKSQQGNGKEKGNIWRDIIEDQPKLDKDHKQFVDPRMAGRTSRSNWNKTEVDTKMEHRAAEVITSVNKMRGKDLKKSSTSTTPKDASKKDFSSSTVPKDASRKDSSSSTAPRGASKRDSSSSAAPPKDASKKESSTAAKDAPRKNSSSSTYPRDAPSKDSSSSTAPKDASSTVPRDTSRRDSSSKVHKDASKKVSSKAQKNASRNETSTTLRNASTKISLSSTAPRDATRKETSSSIAPRDSSRKDSLCSTALKDAPRKDSLASKASTDGSTTPKNGSRKDSSSSKGPKYAFGKDSFSIKVSKSDATDEILSTTVSEYFHKKGIGAAERENECTSYLVQCEKTVERVEAGEAVTVVARILVRKDELKSAESIKLFCFRNLSAMPVNKDLNLLKSLGSKSLVECVRPVHCCEFTYVTVINSLKESISIKKGQILGHCQKVSLSSMTSSILNVAKKPIHIYSLRKVYFKPEQSLSLTVYIKPPFPEDKNMLVKLVKGKHIVKNLEIASRPYPTFQFDSKKKEMTLDLEVLNRDAQYGCLVDAKQFVGTVQSIMTQSQIEEVTKRRRDVRNTIDSVEKKEVSREKLTEKDDSNRRSSSEQKIRGQGERSSRCNAEIKKRVHSIEKRISQRESVKETQNKEVANGRSKGKENTEKSGAREKRASVKSENITVLKGREVTSKSRRQSKSVIEKYDKRKSSGCSSKIRQEDEKRLRIDRNGFDKNFTDGLFPDNVFRDEKKRDIDSFDIVAAEEVTVTGGTSVLCEIRHFKYINGCKAFTPIHSEKNLVILNNSYELFNSSNALVKVIPSIPNLTIKTGDLLGKCIVAEDFFPLQVAANCSLIPGGTSELKVVLGGDLNKLEDYSDVILRNLDLHMKFKLIVEKKQVQTELRLKFSTVQVKNISTGILHFLAGQIIGEAVKAQNCSVVKNSRISFTVSKERSKKTASDYCEKVASEIDAEIVEELKLFPFSTEPSVLFKVQFKNSTVYSKPTVNAGKLVISHNKDLQASCSPEYIYSLGNPATEYFFRAKLTNTGKESMVIKKEDRFVHLLLDKFHSFETRLDLNSFGNYDFASSTILKAVNCKKQILQPRSKTLMDFKISTSQIGKSQQKKSDILRVVGQEVLVLNKIRNNTRLKILPQKARIVSGDGDLKVLVENGSEFEKLVSEINSSFDLHIEVFVIIKYKEDPVEVPSDGSTQAKYLEVDLEEKRVELRQAALAFQLALDSLPISPPGV